MKKIMYFIVLIKPCFQLLHRYVIYKELPILQSKIPPPLFFFFRKPHSRPDLVFHKSLHQHTVIHVEWNLSSSFFLNTLYLLLYTQRISILSITLSVLSRCMYIHDEFNEAKGCSFKDEIWGSLGEIFIGITTTKTLKNFQYNTHDCKDCCLIVLKCKKKKAHPFSNTCKKRIRSSFINTLILKLALGSYKY